MKQVEITVKLNEPKEVAINKLIKKGFSIIRQSFANDIYMANTNISINDGGSRIISGGINKIQRNATIQGAPSGVIKTNLFTPVDKQTLKPAVMPKDGVIKIDPGIVKRPTVEPIKGTIDTDRANEILKKYQDMKNDIIGAIGESMGVYYKNLGRGKILAAFSTSGWDTEGKGSKRKVIARGMEENLQLLNDEELKQQFHDENNKALKDLMQKVKNAEYESKNFKLKIGGEVKADTVYVIMSPEVNRELFYFGVSNKTSYSESDILKIQTTSLSAIVNNLYKVGDLTNTGELSLALKTILINTVLDQWESYSFENFQKLLNFVVDYYGEVWFTGGLEDKSRADFFSAYTMGKLYFIPMSYILIKIQENILKGENFFGKIAINKYMIQDKDLKEKIELIEKKTSKTKEDKLEEEELKFSKGFLDTIKNYKGLYINKQSDRFANFYEIIAEDIVKKVSKADARITVKHGIIFSDL